MFCSSWSSLLLTCRSDDIDTRFRLAHCSVIGSGCVATQHVHVQHWTCETYVALSTCADDIVIDKNIHQQTLAEWDHLKVSFNISSYEGEQAQYDLVYIV